MALITPIVKSTGSTEWERVDDIKGFVFEAGYECVITAIRQQSNHMNYIDYPGTGIYLDDIILVSKTKKESDGMDIRQIWNSKWPITYNPYNPECNSEEYNLKYGSWADGYPDPDPFE